MYTRNFARQRYTPPPGYDGTAFDESTTTKLHSPQELIRDEIREERAIQDVPEPISDTPVEVKEPEENKHHPQETLLRTLNQLFHSLHGKLGSEELILLMVMLLIAEDGLGAEVLILGMALIAGSG